MESNENLESLIPQDPALGTAEAMTTPANFRPDPDAGFHQLNAGHISAERISGLIFFGIVCAGLLAGLVFRWFNGGFDTVFYIMAGAGAVIALGLLWSALAWPAISYRHTFWRLDSTGLEIRSGVFWKHRTSVPIARVQHADVSQGPLQRNFDIGTLTVHTAGTSNSSVILAGLGHTVALDLRDRLVRQNHAESGKADGDETVA